MSGQLLDGYRTMGCFASGHIALSSTDPLTIATPTINSFKIYSDTLTIKVVSPTFNSPVMAIATFNDITYLYAGGIIYKMKYHHCIAKWIINTHITNHQCSMLRFDDIIILSQANIIHLIHQADNIQTTMQIPFPINRIMHPVTYINKLIAYNQHNIALINPISNKILYTYPNIQQYLTNNTITTVQPSYLPHIIAIALNSGCILITNLKTGEIIFQMKQKVEVKSIAFSNHESLMATGDIQGSVILWDLQQKRILFKFDNICDGSISDLFFIPSMYVLTCFSAQSNSIKQLRINLSDNKILTLLRERVGLKHQVTNCIIHNNHDITLNSLHNTMFMSLYSHSNNYILPHCLHTHLPTHIRNKDFTLQLYHEQTLTKTINVHERIIIGKISLSKQYFIVATSTKAMRISSQVDIKWNISNIHDMALYHQHFIFFFANNDIHVCDFNTETILKSMIDYGKCNHSTLNHYGNLLAMQNITRHTIEIWDMLKINKGRQYVDYDGDVLALAFTADNQYLVTSHNNQSLNIWNIINQELYKKYTLDYQIIWLGFTPDNQFLLSVYNNSKEVQIWNNYIGKVSSTVETTHLTFQTNINIIIGDYRQRLNKLRTQQNLNAQEQYQGTQIQEKYLDSIPDVEDDIHQYNFSQINKWMPLIYYDRIKDRNTPNFQTTNYSLPFFLDFKNITEEKEKIINQMKKQQKDKIKQHSEKRDKYLADSKHEITLNQQSTLQDHIATFNMLKSLSIAEVDYQIRKFLINPINSQPLFQMFITLFKDKKDRQIKNILFARALQIIGSGVFQIKQTLLQIKQLHEKWIQQQDQLLSKCEVISERLTDKTIW